MLQDALSGWWTLQCVLVLQVTVARIVRRTLTIVQATCAWMGRHVWMISIGTHVCVHPLTWGSCASKTWTSVDSDPACVRMVLLAPTPSVASLASVLMAGPALTAVWILMTVLVLPASMALRASTGWAAFTAGARREKQVICGTQLVFIVGIVHIDVLKLWELLPGQCPLGSAGTLLHFVVRSRLAVTSYFTWATLTSNTVWTVN
jgi:hypothetical protein